MIWSIELASTLDEAPFPATIQELLDWAERNGLPLQILENLREIRNHDDEEQPQIYDGIEDIWPDYIQKEDFFYTEDEDSFDYDDV